MRFSPRKRRCFRRKRAEAREKKVFSAQAEVFPWNSLSDSYPQSFLRASGGVSRAHKQLGAVFGFSPRKRRCFPYCMSVYTEVSVFSAQAEVFPYSERCPNIVRSFLRASGGVSKGVLYLVLPNGFSPRKRRCFFKADVKKVEEEVFSAQAEVFLQGR